MRRPERAAYIFSSYQAAPGNRGGLVIQAAEGVRRAVEGCRIRVPLSRRLSTKPNALAICGPGAAHRWLPGGVGHAGDQSPWRALRGPSRYRHLAVVGLPPGCRPHAHGMLHIPNNPRGCHPPTARHVRPHNYISEFPFSSSNLALIAATIFCSMPVFAISPWQWNFCSTISNQNLE